MIKKMRYIKSYDQLIEEKLRDIAIGTMMALTPLAAKTQDSKWINRAANANLNFWEKCRLSARSDRSATVAGYHEKTYKDQWARLSDISSFDKEEKKKLKQTLPENIELEDWTALTNEASRLSAIFSNIDYDKYVDENGLLIQDLDNLSEEERKSMEYGISYLEPYFVYYRPIFPKSRKVSPQQLLDYWMKEGGGLDEFKKKLNTGYR